MAARPRPRKPGPALDRLLEPGAYRYRLTVRTALGEGAAGSEVTLTLLPATQG